MEELLSVIGLGALIWGIVMYFDKKDTRSTRYDSKGHSYTQGEDGTRHYKKDSQGNDIREFDIDLKDTVR